MTPFIKGTRKSSCRHAGKSFENTKLVNESFGDDNEQNKENQNRTDAAIPAMAVTAYASNDFTHVFTLLFRSILYLMIMLLEGKGK